MNDIRKLMETLDTIEESKSPAKEALFDIGYRVMTGDNGDAQQWFLEDLIENLPEKTAAMLVEKWADEE